MSNQQHVVKVEKFGNEEIEVLYRKPRKADSYDNNPGGWGYYGELNPRSYIQNDILCEQDTTVTLRDGVKIYVDVYRPANQTNVPAIIAWSFYGKRPFDMPKSWRIMGVPTETVSNMTKFESPDPGYWCKNGYAVINVDPRGIGNSEGDAHVWGEAEAQDAYDVIEWVAQQYWSNGKVGMAGNSGVAMTQWYTAAEQPPHLVCIAPWEGCSDLYREFICEGGIPAVGFNKFVMQDIYGPGLIEDHPAMAEKYPTINAYWESKIAKFDKIKIPAYVCGGWSHLHLRGSINGWRKIRSPKKWLRVHRDFEWPDAYSNENLEDLKKFFDRYLKGIHNGWEMTPRVRLEVMDAFDCDYQKNRPEDSFPLKRTQYKKLYLDASNSSMSSEPVQTESKASYDGETGVITFDMPFEEETEITGFIKLKLWVEVDGNDDADLFINVQKLSTTGEWLPTSVIGEPHPGAPGKLRVSHRELDEKKSTEFQPIHTHKNIQKLNPGEIVPVEIEIYPTSRIWHKGQQIRVQVSGHYIREGWFEPFAWDTNNKGTHIVHTGGQYDSYLQIPVVPPKYQDGEFIYR
ncbi:CocE/NonD family hydrolase [Bacillus sp. B15-48]|uniref:CocE/NonD family hydrolase n=1 Tax=Bacillus sp. B15-48 TaxID=1548601 RepID=UPI00193FC700|nr:CocE/NonD family hydrolase [Bacillus sp. B15-48]MBM4764589.1 CocE/NonD family hydrolase [Bacillus sp. B15-48]